MWRHYLDLTTLLNVFFYSQFLVISPCCWKEVLEFLEESTFLNENVKCHLHVVMVFAVCFWQKLSSNCFGCYCNWNESDGSSIGTENVKMCSTNQKWFALFETC